ncbi:helix-turn-helix domain-containing protein [Actinosynnema sp. NPDC051121]
MTTTLAHTATAPRSGHPGANQVDPRRLWTMQEVAEALKVPLETAYDLRKAGVVPAHRMGKRWLVADSALVQLINGSAPLDDEGDPRQTWTVPEVADQLHLHKDTVYDLVAAGSIAAINLGKHIRIADQTVLRLVCEGVAGAANQAA